MLSSLRPSDQLFLDDLNGIGKRLERAQTQITTGLRVQKASDDPDVVSDILQARATLSRLEQVSFNLGRFAAEVNSAEQSLQAAVKVVDRIRTLGAQGANGTASPETRATLAAEVSEALSQLVGISRTSVEGRYIFSGDADQQPPYEFDAAGDPPVSFYLRSAPTRQAEHPNGTTFSVALSAETIFDPTDPADSIFRAANDLRTALLADDQEAIQAAVDGLKRPATYLNRQLSFYGIAQGRLKEAGEFASRYTLQVRGQLAAIEEADLTEAILELNQARLNQDAALNARARQPNTSLFDYLR